MDEQSKLSRVKDEIRQALGAFSPLERAAFMVAVIACIISVLSLLYKIDDHFLVSIPASGGNLSEGVVGTPRFINPLLAITDVDHDITSLVYRGLMKKDATGTIVPDLAESYNVSPDGLTYTFKLKDAQFQDGQKITADDILFTIKSAEDPILKSPERIKWSGVLVQAVDPSTVSFTLKHSYAPFLENTTIGILPKHIWSAIPYESWAYSDYNTKNAVGDGFFQIKNVAQNSSGIPNYYELKAVHPKGEKAPRISSITIHFFASEDTMIAAYKKGSIDAMGGIDPDNAKQLEKDGAAVLQTPLPRVFGLFFNQSQAKIFTDSTVRKAVSLAINKQAVVSQVLKGYGTTGNGPIPDSSTIQSSQKLAEQAATPEQIKAMLEKAGWKMGSDGIYAKAISKKETRRLSFEISTNDTPELTQAVDLIAQDLAAVGIEAVPKVYETGSLNQDIIRPRKFQSLFFGQIVSNQSDLYAFWHSSQRTDPGLNISGYANAKTDGLLEQGLGTLDPDKENTMYASFEKEIGADMPAVFVYSPSYIYVVRPELTGITLGHVDATKDRFADIVNWYLATDRVWGIFAKK